MSVLSSSCPSIDLAGYRHSDCTEPMTFLLPPSVHRAANSCVSPSSERRVRECCPHSLENLARFPLWEARGSGANAVSGSEIQSLAQLRPRTRWRAHNPTPPHELHRIEIETARPHAQDNHSAVRLNPGNAAVIDSNDEPVARMISAPPSHARSSNAINQTAIGRLPVGPAVSGLFR